MRIRARHEHLQMQVNNRFCSSKVNLHVILVDIRCHNSWGNPSAPVSSTLARFDGVLQGAWSWSDDISFLLGCSSAETQTSLICDDCGLLLPVQGCFSVVGVWGLSEFDDGGAFPFSSSSFLCCSNISWRRFPCSSIRICRVLWIWTHRNSWIVRFLISMEQYRAQNRLPNETFNACRAWFHESKSMGKFSWTKHWPKFKGTWRAIFTYLKLFV